jgi:NADH-quinone oxidoreductase subunit C
VQSTEQLLDRIHSGCPGSHLELIKNPAPAAQHSLLVPRDDLVRVARLLRDDQDLQYDFCSNVTGIDWLDRTTKVKMRRLESGEEKEVEETRVIPGFLEVLYHLYSMSRKDGPIVLRVRTGDRLRDVTVPSLTPVWRSCELQEREIYDLFGVVFEGHPDLRRLLMWEGFRDHPMRKDYVEPDDYEYEPTAHDRVLERAREHSRRDPANQAP